MLGYTPISATPASAFDVVVDENIYYGEFRAYLPRINATLGFAGDLDIPLATVEGTLSISTLLVGALDIPAPIIVGTFKTESAFQGDLYIPLARITGTFNGGNGLLGSLYVPVPIVAGTFASLGSGDLAEGYFAGDLDIPLPSINGTFLQDSVVVEPEMGFGGGTVCQQ